MQDKYLYLLLFGIPGLIFSVIVAFLAAGFAGGIFWIFIYGDNGWPDWTEKVIIFSFVLAFLGIWISTLWTGYKFGLRQTTKTNRRKHVLFSILATAGFSLIIILNQFSVGNLGPETDGLVCRDFCLEEGYSISETTPADSANRSCICRDEFGEQQIIVSMKKLSKRNSIQNIQSRTN